MTDALLCVILFTADSNDLLACVSIVCRRVTICAAVLFVLFGALFLFGAMLISYNGIKHSRHPNFRSRVFRLLFSHEFSRFFRVFAFISSTRMKIFDSIPANNGSQFLISQTKFKRIRLYYGRLDVENKLIVQSQCSDVVAQK